eukprot:scaffold1671_cov344-Pavlova_lutheri.AAC.17
MQVRRIPQTHEPRDKNLTPVRERFHVPPTTTAHTHAPAHVHPYLGMESSTDPSAPSHVQQGRPVTHARKFIRVGKHPNHPETHGLLRLRPGS